MIKLRIIYFTDLFPNKNNPTKGIFNLSRIKALKKNNAEIKVVSPIGLTPPERFLFPIPRLFDIINYLKLQMKIPFKEKINNIQVIHPKWFWLPRRFFWKYEVDLLHFFVGKKINEIIEDFEPDIIITSWLHPYGTYAKYLKRNYNVPVISISEGSDLLVFPKKYPGIKYIIKLANEYIDKTIFVSDRMSLHVKKYYNISKSQVIHNGYDNDLFYYEENTNHYNSKIKLLSIGNLCYIKGHDILLDAMSGMENVELTIIGDGEKRNNYKNLINSNRLNSKVHLLGNMPQKNLRKYIVQSDLFCLPSRSESFGISALEAMACGVPVVATNVGGLSDLIINGFNGYMCEPESPELLAEAIIKANNTVWDNKAISKWARDNFSWDKWARQMIESIDILIRKFRDE